MLGCERDFAVQDCDDAIQERIKAGRIGGFGEQEA
jgi:hypothetical protein